MILITGAGGKTGRAIVKAIARTESVCAFVHRSEQEPALKTLGAQKVIVGDMRDEVAIRIALQDAKAVYHICPNMCPDEMNIAKVVLNEAMEAGVEHFVYHSVLHTQTEKIVHHWQKMRVEETLFETGLPFTILQPAPYMQNLLSGWQRIVEEGILRVPYSVYSRFSFVDLDDVAEAAAKVVSEAKYRNAIFELAGTLPMSHVDVAETIGRALNRQVRAETEEIEAWRLRGEAARLDPYVVENLVKMFDYYHRWGLVGNPTLLGWILGRTPTSLAAFAVRTGRRF